MSCQADKHNFLEFWVKMAKMTLKVKVNDPNFQYQLRVSNDVWCKFGDSSSNLWQKDRHSNDNTPSAWKAKGEKQLH